MILTPCPYDPINNGAQARVNFLNTLWCKNSNLKNSNLKNSNLKNSNLKNSVPGAGRPFDAFDQFGKVFSHWHAHANPSGTPPLRRTLTWVVRPMFFFYGVKYIDLVSLGPARCSATGTPTPTPQAHLLPPLTHSI